MSEDDQPVEVKLSSQKRQIYLNNLFRGGNAPFQQRELNLFGTFCSSHPNLTFSVRSNHQNFNLMLRKPVITETDSEENKLIRKGITNDFFSQFAPQTPVVQVKPSAKPSVGGLLKELSNLTPDFDFKATSFKKKEDKSEVAETKEEKPKKKKKRVHKYRKDNKHRRYMRAIHGKASPDKGRKGKNSEANQSNMN